MNAKQRKAEKKRAYDYMKDIRKRYEAGEPTTFAERNSMYIYLKRLEKKKVLTN
jgi:hypothetical protein